MCPIVVAGRVFHQVGLWWFCRLQWKLEFMIKIEENLLKYGRSIYEHMFSNFQKLLKYFFTDKFLDWNWICLITSHVHFSRFKRNNRHWKYDSILHYTTKIRNSFCLTGRWAVVLAEKSPNNKRLSFLQLYICYVALQSAPEIGILAGSGLHYGSTTAGDERISYFGHIV